MRCENTILKFRELERKIGAVYSKTTRAGKHPLSSNLKANEDAPTVKKEKPGEKPKRPAGAKLKYLNKFSSNVEECTYMGPGKNNKLKCSVGKGHGQKFIYIDENHVVYDD